MSKFNLQRFKFNLQRFSEEATGSNIDDPVQTGNLEEFIEKIDPVTKKPVKIPKNMESILGHFISTTRSSVEGQYKPLLEQLESESTELKDIKAEYEKLKEQSMTAEEKARENAKKVILEHEKKAKIASEKAELWEERFKKSTIKNDILSSFSFANVKLCNAEQTALCFETEGRARVSEIIDPDGKPTGRFETRVSVMIENDKGETEEVEGTPAEVFKKWISLERNSHHVANDITPGGGTHRSSVGGKKVDYISLSPTERMNRYREQARAK